MALGGFAGPSTFCILPSTFALLPFLHSSFCILPSTFTLGDLVAAGQPLHNARVLCHQGPQYHPLRHYRGLLLHAPLYASSAAPVHSFPVRRTAFDDSMPGQTSYGTYGAATVSRLPSPRSSTRGWVKAGAASPLIPLPKAHREGGGGGRQRRDLRFAYPLICLHKR